MGVWQEFSNLYRKYSHTWSTRLFSSFARTSFNEDYILFEIRGYFKIISS